MDLFNEEKESDGNHKHTSSSIEEEVSSDLVKNLKIIEDINNMIEIFSDLTANSDILLKILASLPPKSLFKFKCVSKEISNLIEQPHFISEHFRTFKARKPVTVFFYQKLEKDKLDYVQGDGEPFFLSTCADAGPLPDSSLNFMKEGKNRDYIKLIDSSNGLLLCQRTSKHKKTKMNTYYVCNPRTKEKAVLPHPPNKRSTLVLFALFAQPTKGFLRYMVISVYRTKHEDPWSELSIFSSETGEWTEFKDRLPILSHEIEIGLKVAVKDVFFWDCLEGHILVCYYKKSHPCFDVIKAPKAQIRRCLWDYNGKLLCYCHGYDGEFPAWVLSFNDNKQFEWKQEDSEQFKTLNEEVCTEYCRETRGYVPTVLPHISFRILAFDPDSKTMYLWIFDIIFSFDFMEKRLERILGFHISENVSHFPTSNALPYVHCLMPIEIGKKSAEVRGNES